MTRSHLVAALIVACTFSPLALAIQAPLPTQPGLAQRTEIQYEKLRHLLEATLAIETRFQNAIVHLQDTYGDVEVGNLYQGIDLTTVDGIHTVRQRLNALRAKYDAFTDAKEQYWAEEDEQVRTSVEPNTKDAGGAHGRRQGRAPGTLSRPIQFVWSRPSAASRERPLRGSQKSQTSPKTSISGDAR